LLSLEVIDSFKVLLSIIFCFLWSLGTRPQVSPRIRHSGMHESIPATLSLCTSPSENYPNSIYLDYYIIAVNESSCVCVVRSNTLSAVIITPFVCLHWSHHCVWCHLGNRWNNNYRQDRVRSWTRGVKGVMGL
jgi:hypothetical protein